MTVRAETFVDLAEVLRGHSDPARAAETVALHDDKGNLLPVESLLRLP